MSLVSRQNLDYKVLAVLFFNLKLFIFTKRDVTLVIIFTYIRYIIVANTILLRLF